MCTPELHLKTAFLLDDQGRIVSTREPGASRGPLFTLVRSKTCCAWAIRVDVPHDIAGELDRLAREEPPARDLRDGPVYAEGYVSLVRGWGELGGKATTSIRVTGGPLFRFPDTIPQHTGVALVEDELLLEHNFRGWVPGEIAAGRSPVLAIIAGGHPASVCFCARRSDSAAEAGLETAEAYRGRGFGPRVAAAWALAIRATGRIPLYSTSWANGASLAVARKLGLVAYASAWSLSS